MEESNTFNIMKHKKIIIKYLILILLFFVIAVVLLVNAVKENTIIPIFYTESSKVDYNVYLKENEFFENNYLEKDNQYIASLIDYIEASFNYKLQTTQKDTDYKYKYRIEAQVNVEEKTTHNSLYNFKETILEENEFNQNTNNELQINEKINIDYNKYNDIIKRFVDTYSLDNSDSTITINMYVDMEGIESSNTGKSVATLTIPLTKKTIAIDIATNTINNNENNNQPNKTLNIGKYFLSILLVIASIAVGIRMFRFINDSKDEELVYKMKLKDIISNYGSYIQKIDSEFDLTGYQAIEIKGFEDLLQIREIIQAPILMLKGNLVTHFIIITNNKILYMYNLYLGNKNNRIADKKEDDDEYIMK